MRLYLLIAFLTILVFSSCTRNFNRELRKEKYDGRLLLYKQKIKGNQIYSDYTLGEYIKQKPNRKFLLNWSMPYWRAFIIGEKHFDKEEEIQRYQELDSAHSENIALKRRKLESDSSRSDSSRIEKLKKKRIKVLAKQKAKIQEGNWMMRTVGEPASLLDTALTRNSLEQLRLFYESKGFFEANVQVKVDTFRKKKAVVTYRVDRGEPFRFHRIYFDIESPEIRRIVKKSMNNSKIVTGNNYEVTALTGERERLNTLMKDQGYFEFQRQYLLFEVDTTQGYKKADVTIVVREPNQGEHQKFTVREVNFILDRQQPGDKDSTLYNGVQYVHGSGKYSKKILDQNIKIKPGSFYSATKSQTTQRLLGNFDLFKFVNIHYQKVHEDSTSLVAYINSNSQKKQTITSEVGINVNVNQVQNQPGPFGNLSYRSRKVFRGFEILEANLLYSLQGQVSFIEDGIFPSREIGGNTGLIFPRAIFQNVFLGQKAQARLENLTPRTRINVGFGNVRRKEYTRSNFQVLYSYSGQKKNHRYNFSPMDLNIVNTPQEDPAFSAYLDSLANNNGINLRQSFQSSVISSIGFNYVFNNNDLSKNQQAFYFLTDIESGGTFYSLRNLAAAEDTTRYLFGLPVYQYARISVDLRTYIPLSETGTIAMRLNAGIARPIGQFSVLPYEKFFFSGGLNSVRAWSPRRLGPGSFGDFDTTATGQVGVNYTFEQPGDILLEGNLELRSQLVGFVNGALFVDAGNIWTFEEDEARPGAQWRPSSFLREIAVGAGFGLRFDFSFLIFRLDIAQKVWDPALQKFLPRTGPLLQDLAYNIGIGYPF